MAEPRERYHHGDLRNSLIEAATQILDDEGIKGLSLRAVARRAAGFGMRVVGWTRSMREVEGVETLALPEVLAQSDFVSVHVALAEETRGLIGEKAIAAM